MDHLILEIQAISVLILYILFHYQGRKLVHGKDILLKNLIRNTYPISYMNILT